MTSTAKLDSTAVERGFEEYRRELVGVLLPHAGLGVRGRRRRAGDARARAWRSFDSFEGRAVAAVVALPDREQRLLRHVEGAPAPRDADRPHGAGPRRRSRSAEPCPKTCGSARSPTRSVVSDAGDPAEQAVAARVGSARVRRRAATPAASPAGGAHPARGAEVEGRARSRSCSTRRCVSVNSALQRARSTLAESNVSDSDRVGADRPGPAGAAGALRRRVRALRRRRDGVVAARRRDDDDAAVPAVDARRVGVRQVAARRRARMRGIAAAAGRRERRAGVRAVALEPRRRLRRVVDPHPRDLRRPDHRDQLLRRPRVCSRSSASPLHLDA